MAQLSYIPYFLVIFFHIPVLIKSRYCAGGRDPSCYFPDPDEPLEPYIHHNILLRSSRRLVPKNENAIGFMDDEDLQSSNRSRRKEKHKQDEEEVGEEKTSLELADMPKKDEKYEEDYDTGNSGDLNFIPLKEGEIIHEKLRTYPASGQNEWVYPPFTYRGFHAPKTWGKIPNWYFLPITEKKIGKFTGLLVSEQSGISFMNFSTLHARELKRKRERGEEKEKTGPFQKTKMGVSSANCDNTLFPAPLDIITANAREDLTAVEFKFDNYANVYSFVMFRPEDGSDLLFVKLQTPPKVVSAKPSIEGGATTGDALFLDRVSIRFGTDSDAGSEHRINGKSYGMELQFFFNTQDRSGDTPYWKTLENYIIDNDPLQYGKHLLVLCVLVEVAPQDETEPPSGKVYNEGLSFLGKAAESFWATNNEEMYRAKATKKKVLRMQDFFQIPKSGLYYTYSGCLTHPPCLNNTRYAVFENPLYMRNEDWRKFLFIPSQFSDTEFIAGNFRPMDVMTFTDNRTHKVVPYDAGAKERLSWTVRRSRRTTEKERRAEYDYYEDIEVAPHHSSKKG